MDNQAYKEAQEKLNKLAEDKEFSKLIDKKEMVLLHLKQPEQQLLDSYYSNSVATMKNDLVRRFINKDGKDQSDFFRGYISALEAILNLKNIFENVSKLQADVDAKQKEIR